MDHAPKRSIGETVGQLLVIAVLIAILIGAVILLRQHINDRSASAPPPNTTYNFRCCTGYSPDTIYHPGEVVRLAWTSVKAPSGEYPARRITLTAWLSHSFTSVTALKTSAKAGTFSTTSGPFIAAAGPLHVSNRSGEEPVMTIRIPDNAVAGYYDLVTTASQKDFSVISGAILDVRR